MILFPTASYLLAAISTQSIFSDWQIVERNYRTFPKSMARDHRNMQTITDGVTPPDKAEIESELEERTAEDQHFSIALACRFHGESD